MPKVTLRQYGSDLALRASPRAASDDIDSRQPFKHFSTRPRSVLHCLFGQASYAPTENDVYFRCYYARLSETIREMREVLLQHRRLQLLQRSTVRLSQEIHQPTGAGQPRTSCHGNIRQLHDAGWCIFFVKMTTLWSASYIITLSCLKAVAIP